MALLLPHPGFDCAAPAHTNVQAAAPCCPPPQVHAASLLASTSPALYVPRPPRAHLHESTSASNTFVHACYPDPSFFPCLRKPEPNSQFPRAALPNLLDAPAMSLLMHMPSTYSSLLSSAIRYPSPLITLIQPSACESSQRAVQARVKRGVCRWQGDGQLQGQVGWQVQLLLHEARRWHHQCCSTAPRAACGATNHSMCVSHPSQNNGGRI